MEGENKEKKKRQRIGNSEAVVLVLFAVVFDLFSLIPYLNIVVVIVAQSLLALFFFIHGVSVFSKKRGVTYAIATIAEFIPFISILPAITTETIVMIILTRIEDKTGIDPTKPKVSVAPKK